MTGSSPFEPDPHFLRLAEDSGEVVLLLSADDRMDYLSGRVWDLLGYTPDEVRGCEPRGYLHPDEDPERFQAPLRAARKGRTAETTPYRALARDGQEERLITRFLPAGPDGRVVALTRLDSREEAVGPSTGEQPPQVAWRDYLYALDQHAMVTITDRGGRLLYVNPRFCEATGYTREALIGRNHREFNTGTHTDAFYAGLWQTITAGGVWQGEITLRGARDEILWTWLTVVPVTGPTGAVERFIGIRTDITEQFHNRQQLDRARREAEEANRLKSEFLANVSHELRTPLNALIGMADLLGDTELTGEQRGHLQVIRTASNNLRDLIENLLDLTRIEAGQLPVEIAPFELPGLLERQLEMLRPRVREKGLTLESTIDPDVPRVVQGDPGRLRQIITNLVGNALKFTQRGRVEVTVAPAPAAEGRLRFTVRDTGIGIPEDKQGAIFESFTQADSGITRRYGGTGLGLTICRELVERMGGELKLESEEGLGSTFWFDLPLPDALPLHPLPEPAEPGATPEAGRADGADEGKRLAGVQDARILVAEDEATNALLVRTLLERAGARVTVVEDGEAALTAWREATWDAVLMDLRMPALGGEAATRKLRQEEAAAGRPATPVVALSAHAQADYRRRCLEAGFDDYLTKPLEHRALLATLARLVGM